MTLISNLFTIIAALVLPVGAAVWLGVKRKGYMKPVLLGAATFFVFQVLTRIPALQLIDKMIWYSMFKTSQPVLNALFLGGTAALFEEGGRWIVMRLFMKNKNRLNDGIAFGIGHGGIEAVLLVGINVLVLFILNDHSTSPLQLFAGGFERICTMVIHIAFSVMVLKSVVLKNPLWLLVAFVLHTAIDMAAVLMAGAGASILVLEGVVGVFSLLLLVYVLIEFKKYKGVEIR